jgi:putative flippase GtrA
LAVGAAATLLDICILLICVKVFHLLTWFAAMTGVFFGSTFTFFMNRHFAFRDHNPKLAPQALKFVVATGICMVIHGGLVSFLRDRQGVPVVLAKLIADICVFSIGQLLVLRYLVFPKARSGRHADSREANNDVASRAA